MPTITLMAPSLKSSLSAIAFAVGISACGGGPKVVDEVPGGSSVAKKDCLDAVGHLFELSDGVRGKVLDCVGAGDLEGIEGRLLVRLVAQSCMPFNLIGPMADEVRKVSAEFQRRDGDGCASFISY